MRDSIGGTMLFWIVLVLLSIFIVFIAFIIKYARVYKIKNSIVNYLERNEGVSTQEEFENQLLSYGYSSEGSYKLCKYLSKDADGKIKGGYYYVELRSETTFPLIGSFMAITINIKGETKYLTTGTNLKNDTDSWFLTKSSECKNCSLSSGSCVTIDA